MVRSINDSLNRHATIVDAFDQRAMNHGSDVAVRFLSNGKDDTSRLTYDDLRTRSRQLAGKLRSICSAGDRAVILCTWGPDYLVSLFACFYSQVVAVPLYPPRPNRSWDRLASVLADARPQVALIDSSFQVNSSQSFVDATRDHPVRLVLTDQQASDETSDLDTNTSRHQSDLAYLQYTSGSTSAPKGVLISHGNVLSNCDVIGRVGDATYEHVVGSWLPLHHDMGLIGGVMTPLLLGLPAILMPPEMFVMRPYRWLEMITRYRVTVSAAPNFAYDLCVKRVKDAQLNTIDLSTWRVAFNGSERIDPASLHRFQAKFQRCGFRPQTFMPCYGLAESTLFVTGNQLDVPPFVRKFEQSTVESGAPSPADHGLELVGSGKPDADHEVAIVDPDTHHRRPNGKIGEIWVRGPSVADGYWNRPDLTQAVFMAKTADAEDTEGPYLRTGDLGFFYREHLFVTGRIKDMIIIHGRNLFPEDVEQVVENAHPAVQPHGSIAMSLNDEPDEKLIVVAEADIRSCQLPKNSRRIKSTSKAGIQHNAPNPPSSYLAEIRNAIQNAVANQCDVRVHQVLIIKMHTLPKTSSGKKRRDECRNRLQNDLLTTLN